MQRTLQKEFFLSSPLGLADTKVIKVNKAKSGGRRASRNV